MKKIIVCLLLLATVANGMAQPSKKDIEKHQKEVERSLKKGKIVVSLDTVFNKGVPYCIAKILKKGFMGMGHSYDFYDFEGKNVFVAKIDDELGTFELTFLDSGVKINAPADVTYIDEHVVANGLFKDGKLDEAALRKYVLLNEGNHEQQLRERERREANKLARVAGAANNVRVGVGGNGTNRQNRNDGLVDRDRTSHIYIFGERIHQDHKDVGTIKSVRNSEGREVFKVYSKSGSLIAECTCLDFTCKKINILTFKDNENDAFTPPVTGFAKDHVVKYLVDRGFL